MQTISIVNVRPAAAAAGNMEQWFNQTLIQVESIVEGGFIWHNHTHDDEFFVVLKGALAIAVERLMRLNCTLDKERISGVTSSAARAQRIKQEW